MTLFITSGIDLKSVRYLPSLLEIVVSGVVVIIGKLGA